ncbi:MAG: Rrf2 family transcriptional regulator [Candidatus Firestonebacteria bacterium]
MLIMRSTDYAVRALKYLAEKGEEASAAELTKQLKIPWPFMRKIMQLLGKNGFVKSSKGPGGGFILLRKPEEVFLIELIKLFQGPVCLNECVFKKKICVNKSSCFLSKKLGEIEEYAYLVLSRINLKEIIEGGRNYGDMKNN